MTKFEAFWLGINTERADNGHKEMLYGDASKLWQRMLEAESREQTLNLQRRVIAAGTQVD